MIEINKATLLQYSRYILRHLGHSLPASGWLETYPGMCKMQLAAFCKHCKKPYAIYGDPDVTSELKMGFAANEYHLFEISSNVTHQTSGAWSTRSGPVKNLITTIGLRDFSKQTPIMAWLQLAKVANGLNPLPTPSMDDEGPDPDPILKQKIQTIDQKYFCSKIRAWI